jgi:hypothetical protein
MHTYILDESLLKQDTVVLIYLSNVYMLYISARYQACEDDCILF